MLGTASAAHRNDASIPNVFDEKDLERGNEGGLGRQAKEKEAAEEWEWGVPGEPGHNVMTMTIRSGCRCILPAVHTELPVKPTGMYTNLESPKKGVNRSSEHSSNKRHAS